MRADFVRAALDRHERALLGYANRITGDLDAARDVVQEAFVRLWSQDESAVSARLGEWLFTVCRNLALDHQRRERAMKAREQQAATAPPPESPGRGVEHDDQVRVLRNCVESLPDKQQEAIRLRFQGGMSYREIGAVMNESEGYVGWLLHQGLKRLRERMEPREARS